MNATATPAQPVRPLPYLGHGVGLRRPHFDALLAQPEAVDFVEILSDNFMAFGGRARQVARQAAERWPVLVHGVGLSIGSVDPLDLEYVEGLVGLVRELGAPCFSDHLCYSSAGGVHYHDLIPLPFTEEAAQHVAARAREVQDRAEVPFLLENPSYYMRFEDSELSEIEFLNATLEAADCGLLLDVNNVWVNAQNHGYDPRAFIDQLDPARVGYIHMAGHTRTPELIIDTHGAQVAPEVLDLYAYALARLGPTTTLLEWDNDIPALEVLLDENQRLRDCAAAALGQERRA